MAWVLIVILISNGNPSGFRVEFGSEQACETARQNVMTRSPVNYAACFRT